MWNNLEIRVQDLKINKQVSSMCVLWKIIILLFVNQLWGLSVIKFVKHFIKSIYLRKMYWWIIDFWAVWYETHQNRDFEPFKYVFPVLVILNVLLKHNFKIYLFYFKYQIKSRIIRFIKTHSQKTGLPFYFIGYFLLILMYWTFFGIHITNELRAILYSVSFNFKYKTVY